MVRYAEGPETSVEVTIHASVVAVWEAISDPALPVQHSDELVEAHWLEHLADEPGVGSTIHGRSHHETIGEWTTVSIVTDWQPGVSFGLAVREVEDSAARWSFQIEDYGNSKLLRQRYLIGPGPSGVKRWIDADLANEEAIIEERLAFQAENMLRTLEAVKSEIEASPDRP